MEATFGMALELLRQGKFVARMGWNANHYLGLQVPDAGSMNTLPYIYMIVGLNSKSEDMQGNRIPWVASQTDLLARDWEDVTNKPL